MFVIALTTAIGAIAGGAGVMIFGSSAGIRRERDLARRRDEPDFTLTLQAPDRVTQRARMWTGLHVLDADADADAADNRESMLV